MKNKNAILMDLSIHVVGSLFSKFYQQENRLEGFDPNTIPTMIENECDKQAKLCFFDQKPDLTDKDLFLMKMHAVNLYDRYFSKILLDRIEEDRRTKVA
jgi:hypothetical protein